MNNIEDLGSTGLYAYTSLISLFILAPGVLLFESDVWEAMQAAAAAEGAVEFFWSLLSVGLLYHLFNQVSACVCVGGLAVLGEGTRKGRKAGGSRRREREVSGKGGGRRG